MYPIAKNKTIFTPDIFDEGYKKLWRSVYYKSIRKILCIIAVILVASVLFIFNTGMPVFFLFSEFFFTAVISVYILWIIPKKQKQRLYKKLGMGENGTPWRSYSFYEDHVTVDFPNGETEDYPYDNISNIYNGRKILLLYTSKGNHNMLIDKKAFIGEIPAFLKTYL